MRRYNNVIVSSTVAYLAAAQAGCAAHPAPALDNDAGAADVRVPTTGDGRMVNVRVVLPPDVCAPGGRCGTVLAFAPRVLVDNKRVTLDAWITLAPGRHTLDVSGVRAPLDVQAGPDRTITLAVAQMRCEKAPPVFGHLDFGQLFSPQYGPCPSRISGVDQGSIADVSDHGTFQLSDPGGCGRYASNPRYRTRKITSVGECRDLWLYDSPWTVYRYNITYAGDSCQPRFGDVSGEALCKTWFHGLALPTLIPPSTLDFQIVHPGPVNRVTSVVIGEGEHKQVTLALPQVNPELPEVWETTLELHGHVELPTAPAYVVVVGTTPVTGRRLHNYRMPEMFNTDHGEISKKVLRAAKTEREVGFDDYMVSAAGRTHELFRQTDSTVVLHRLDISHPVLSRADGSTYERPGQATLFYNGYATAKTETGVGYYVLPGTYELVVEFSAAPDAPVQRQQHRLTF